MNTDRKTSGPRVLVFSSLFPSTAEPGAGLFIRERMFRVAQHLPMVVVAPRPWFPGQGLIRLFRPHFRPPAPRFEIDDGIEIHRPRFLSLPGLCKWADGQLMALGAARTVRRLQRRLGIDIIDAHFLYPDGDAAGLLGRWLGVPVTITLRGTEARLVRTPAGRKRGRRALARASRTFAVSASLRRVALDAGAPPETVEVVPNGVDTQRFFPIDRAEARTALGLAPEAPVLVSVGTLVERKGFHRVIELLPRLRQRFPGLVYMVVGGAGPEGDWRQVLEQQAHRLGVDDNVRFLGPMDPDALRTPLSAADLFVLVTRNEGWANVFLEAMACGLPVITTDVGGNREVVASPEVGRIVPFGDPDSLAIAIEEGLHGDWDRESILAYARSNNWEPRVGTLLERFRSIVEGYGSANTGRLRSSGGCEDQ